KDGGVSWKLILNADKQLGATDLEIDPTNPKILYATVWGDAIYKSTDGGKKWKPIMNGLPKVDYSVGPVRFPISISASSPNTLYAGSDWTDANGHQPARIFRSLDGGASWTILPGGSDPDKVEDYCAAQCSYDNVIEVDPTDPNIVYAAGQFDY